MSKPMVLVHPDEIKIDRPLPFNLYTRSGTLIASKGFTLSNDHARERLANMEVYRILGEAGEEKRGFAAGVAEDEETDSLNGVEHTVTGVQLSLTVQGESEPRTMSSEFYGRILKQVIVVAAPYLRDRRSWHDLIGHSVAVKLQSARAMHSFTTEVLHYNALPAPHLYLRFPASTIRVPFRGATRVDVRVPAMAHLDASRNLPIMIIDMSAKGCLIESEHLLGQVGAQFWLSFAVQVDGAVQDIKMRAAICSSTPKPIRGKLRFGLQFVSEEGSMKADDRKTIRAFIAESFLES